jgi:hypothetical protein
MQEEIILDEFTTYHHDMKVDMIIISRSKNSDYTRQNLAKFHQESTEKICFDQKTGFLLNKTDNLIFIPLFNKNGFLVEYTYTEFDNYDIVSQHNFCLVAAHGKKYVKCANESLSMHQLIFGRRAEKGYKIDHINSDGLDNRRNKLREVTNSANSANQLKRKDVSSKYLGVSFNKRESKWIAEIRHQKKRYFLGRHENEYDAAKIRDIYALHIHREDARLNKNSEGNLLLSDEEILYVLEHGIPEKYKMVEKKAKDLPSNIYQMTNGYKYQFEYNRTKYKGIYTSLEEAVSKMEEKKEELKKQDSAEKSQIEKNVQRNEDGIAFVNTHDQFGNINGTFLLDDEDWIIYIHSSWSLIRKNYAQTVVNGKPGVLHILVYTRHFGQPPEGCSIDHKNSENPFDCRKSNLRAATYSQQTQNQTRKREGFIIYKGVYVEWGVFRARCAVNKKKYQKGPFQTMEEAALAYNELVLEHFGPDSKLNKITTKDSTAHKLYHKSNLTVENLENIKTTADILEIFYCNQDWKKKLNIVFTKIKKDKLPIYIKMAKELKQLEETN